MEKRPTDICNTVFCFLTRCRLRIVDSFGTEAQFNFDGPLPSIGSPGHVGNSLFGKNGLNLKQYMNMFRKYLISEVLVGLL